MKIKFIESPPARPEYKKGDVVDFNGPVEESYAKKFLLRKWAEPVDKVASSVVEKASQEAKETAADETKQKQAYAAEVKAGARGPASQGKSA